MKASQYEVRKHIMSLIFRSDFDPTRPLPSSKELAETLPATINTVNMTIIGMTEEGIIVSHGKKGKFLNPAYRKVFSSNKIYMISNYNLDQISIKGHTVYPFNVIWAFDTELKKSGLSCEYLNISNMNEKNLIEKIVEDKPAGLALLEVNNPHLVMEMKELWLPTVSIDYDALQLGISSSVFSNSLGGFQATKHLIGLGHRKIAAVSFRSNRLIAGSNFEDSVHEERISGYFISMRNAGLNPIIPPPFKNAADAVSTLLAMNPPPTAIFCINNNVSAQILSELRRNRIKVPGDIDMITFDFYNQVDNKKWKLPYIKVDCQGMGKGAAELLISQIKGESSDLRRIVLETELVTF